MNPLVRDAAAIVAAVGTLKLRRGDYWEATSEGVLIVQRGRPDLILTFEAARRFAQEVEEARA